jgi:hypothetical protein
MMDYDTGRRLIKDSQIALNAERYMMQAISTGNRPRATRARRLFEIADARATATALAHVKLYVDCPV